MSKMFALALVLVCTLAGAQTQLPDPALPAPLREWRGWTLQDLPYRACAFLASSAADTPQDFVCAWPGRLTLTSRADGATFASRWQVEAPSWIGLPGDSEHWPQQVSVNGQRQPVLAHAGAPSLWLGRGSFEIAGRIPWRERPQSLALPAVIGLVALTVDGKPVMPIRRDGASITLGRAPAGAPEADSVELRVYRRLADGVPALLTTRILLAVSGQAREETIGPALPAGFAPTALTSAWPARLDGQGRLHVQVQPGSDTLTLEARATAPLAAAVVQLPAAPWPKQEIWSYQAAPRLRVTVARSAVQVDPRQAEVPADWQGLPAFALGDAGTLAIQERSRGQAPDEANRLTLQREAWLDFSGAGWYARDHIGGTMAAGWRLDAAPPYALEQATALNSPGGAEPLLITRGPQRDSSGVEWRTPRVDLSAGLRVPARGALPVGGWRQTFDGVQAMLHFPFGYKLLAAPGADAVSGSWASGWSLFDVFKCAIAVLLAWRLLGIGGAAAIAAMLLLGYQEAGMPLPALIAALGLALVARGLRAGRFGRWTEWLRRAALALLVLAALPFLADQIRFALHPQLEAGDYLPEAAPVAAAARDANLPATNDALRRRAAAPAMRETPLPAAPVRTETSAPPLSADSAGNDAGGAQSSVQTQTPAESSVDRSRLIEHYSRSTVVQTGAGAPSWLLGSSARLAWTGPVLAQQTVRLLIAPPWAVRPLRVALAALLAWLVWRLLRGVRVRPASAAPVILVTLLVCGGIAIAPAAQAQGYPSSELLQQLRERLSKAPACTPACASIAEAQVAAHGDGLHVALEVHAGERVALPLPNDAAAATPLAIQVDGSAAEGLVRAESGALWLEVGRGVHRVTIDFSVSGERLALAFPLQPARVLFDGAGWEASGLADDRLLTQTLSLARARGAAGAAPDGGVQRFPPYVRVVRNLHLGLDWTASADVERLSPETGGFTVDVALLPGEHVASAGIKVQSGKAQVAMPDDANRARWTSTLDKTDTLTLTAPALAQHAEVWNVLVSPTWHVEFSGAPAIGAGAADQNDYRNFEFHPLPGETLTLQVSRPAAAAGAARAIDSVRLLDAAGQRAATQVLAFELRASQGGEQAITLPQDAEVLAASRDGVALNLRAVDGRLSLPVAPGTQRYEVRMRRAGGAALLTRTPQIALGLPAANVSVTLQLPPDRWLLATYGPAVGPAVLYWGELIVLVAIAAALARARRTPLRFRDWLLLGLGFSTFSWIALLVVAAWLFACDWRARSAMLPQRRVAFNLLQLGLALLTLTAVIALASSIPQGLLGQPDMHVAGNGSSATMLQWFSDRNDDALPVAGALTLPMWTYKLLMLGWALWLANAVIGWLRAAFAAWTRDGCWRGKPAGAGAAATAGTPAAPMP